MRAPKFQFMDKLEEMKRRLAREESQLWLAFLPINCKEGVFSLIIKGGATTRNSFLEYSQHDTVF